MTQDNLPPDNESTESKESKEIYKSKFEKPINPFDSSSSYNYVKRYIDGIYVNRLISVTKTFVDGSIFKIENPNGVSDRALQFLETYNPYI